MPINYTHYCLLNANSTSFNELIYRTVPNFTIFFTMYMIDMDLFFRFLKERCHCNQF